MNVPVTIPPLLALCCMAAHANLTIAIPAPSTDVSTIYEVGVDSTSAGAKQIKSLTGATYTTGKSSSASLTETAQGELVLKWSLVYDPADGPYGTSVGLLLPLTPAWDIKDLSIASEIDYDVKAASAYPATSEQMEIGSNLYGDSAKAANAALAQPKWTALADTYQTVKVITVNMAMNSWYSGPDAATTGWTGLTYNVGTAVKNLVFQPQVSWTSATVMKSGTSGSLYIRNVKVIGGEPPFTLNGVGCTGTGLNVEDFAATKSNLAQNYLGGFWYAYADTTSDPTMLNDSSVGSSTILLPAGQNAWSPDAAWELAALTATLEKDVPSSTYLYHRYAGWAGIGTTLPGCNGGSLDLQPGEYGGVLTAISFDLYAGPALGAGYNIDTTKIRRIIFSVSKASVPDAEPYSVNIPVSEALRTTSNNVCVDATMLLQPSWYVTNNLGGTPVPFSANDLTKLSWQIQIEDQADPTKHASANNTFAVGNVKFYGLSVGPDIGPGYSSGLGYPNCVEGIEGSPTRATALRATYTGALQLSYAVDGSTAQIEVRSLDGTRIASFREGASVQNLSLPVALARGTYLVSVQGGRTRQVALLSVVR